MSAVSYTSISNAGGLSISGPVFVPGTLQVAGASVLSGGITVSGAASISDTLLITGGGAVVGPPIVDVFASSAAYVGSALRVRASAALSQSFKLIDAQAAGSVTVFSVDGSGA